jgi:oligopeptidase B
MKKPGVALRVSAPVVSTLIGPVPAARPEPPLALTQPHQTVIHGRTLVDDYFWLRQKSDPEVLRYLEAENTYTEEVLRPLGQFQQRLYEEILGRIKQTDLTVPYRLGEYFYYSRTEEGRQYPYMCRRRGTMERQEELLLDLNGLAQGHPFMALGAFVVSDDGNWLAYSTDSTGYRQYTLFVKDLRTGRTLAEAIERTGSVVWATDNRTLFYTTEDAVSKRSDRLWRHRIGESGSDLVYEERDELYDIGIGRSLDRRMIFLGSYAKTSSEQRFLNADQPHGEFRIILPREDGHEYDADHYEGRLFIRTNKDAKNFRVVSVSVADPRVENWEPFIEHDPAVKIEGVTFFARHSVVSEREGGLNYLRVIDMRSGASHRIATDESDYSLALTTNPEFATTTVRFTYQSMVTPPTVYDYDLDSRHRTLLKQQEVLGGYEPSHYEARRIWAPARDGTKVPISLVFRKGTAFDGSAPLLLYAYGSYGVSMAPMFSSSRLSLLNRGAIYAVAYVRGGGELGEPWRDQGRMMQKMNTFTDFIDCAEHLVAAGYTSPDRLVIQGGSAGGLLVGAVANMRPQLFKAAVAQVPFVDVINTMLDSTLPLTTSEYIEWGNPNEREAFEYMLQYSPYDNITAQAYPAMLVQVSLNDSQVPYWEGAKYVARLRALKTDDNPVLLKANLDAGHGGASGRYDALRETAFTYAFVLWQMGIEEDSETTESSELAAEERS